MIAASTNKMPITGTMRSAKRAIALKPPKIIEPANIVITIPEYSVGISNA